MFEKEAEEYAKEHNHEYYTDNDTFSACLCGFQDGAEPTSLEIDPPIAWCEIPKYTEMNLLPFINNHIEDLTEWDSGALQVREENGVDVVDIEWADGVSAFDLEKVINLIKEKGNITKSELVDECLA